MDTIFALASGPPPAAVAVVRLSGPRSLDIAQRFIGRTPTARVATLATIVDPRGGLTIDRGLVLVFPAPFSFTGEDVVEFQLHGGRAVVAALMMALSRELDCRMASPGEFTRRAFVNGKLNLTAVEGLADLIESETEQQRRQAFQAFDGRFAGLAAAWRELLLGMMASVEAAIDFPDEGESPVSTQAALLQSAADLAGDIEQVLSDRRGTAIRDGYTVVILGPPNVGKSSLMNAIAGRDIAIVSARAGTTRDLIEVRIDLAGAPVVFVDTAGLRDTTDEIEREGIDRARARASAADLVLWLEEPGQSRVAERMENVLFVAAKSDLRTAPLNAPLGAMPVSSITGEGLDALLEAIQKHLNLAGPLDEPALVTRARQRADLEAGLAALRRIEPNAMTPELIGENLRLAARSLERLVGAVRDEDVLTEIFRRFCMGK